MKLPIIIRHTSFILILINMACTLHSAHNSENWKLVWSDEFNYDGLPDPEKWTYDVGGHGWGNKELQYYTHARIENVSVKGGKLSITAQKESYKDMDYTSTRLVSRGKFDFPYGRLEVRAKLPSAKGTWPAIWMMPQNWVFEDGGWPLVGEIDIMEHVGHDPGIIHASAHSQDYQWQKGTQKTGTIEVKDASETFHTYVLERDESILRVYVDETLFFEYKNEGLGETKWPYNQPFYLILNIAIGGAWGSVEGIQDSAFPQSLIVDYVRFYEKQTSFK